MYLGDCLEVMKGFLNNSIDTVITDPPYALTANKKGGTGKASLNLNHPGGRSRITTDSGFMGKVWDSAIPGVKYWEEMLRIAKPGATLLAFGGTRTHHRLMCAIEDAGWEIRDCVMWLYGSGFPKSHDISKAIDKAAGAEREVVGPNRYAGRRTEGSSPDNDDNCYGQYGIPGGVTSPATPAAQLWDGWGTALKPAWEPIILAMKPIDSSKWIIELTPELLDEWEAVQHDYE